MTDGAGEPLANRLARRLAAILLLAAAHYAAARLGILGARAHDLVSPLWPAAGVSLFALLRWGVWLWPGVVLAESALVASHGVPVAGALGIGGGSALQAVVGARLLARAGLRPDLRRLRDVLALTVLGGVATALGASIGVAMLVASGSAPTEETLSLWAVWWTGDAVGVLVVAPLLLTWAGTVRETPPRTWRPAEIALSLVAVAGLAAVVLEPAGDAPYALFPALGWIAFRFGPRGVAAAVTVVAVMGAREAVAGAGTFGGPRGLGYGLQLYVGVLAVTAMAFAAALAERAVADAQQRERARQLAASQRLARLADWRYDAGRDRVEASPELLEILGVTEGATGTGMDDFLERVHPDDRSAVRAELQGALFEGRSYEPSVRVVRPNGEVRVLAVKGELVSDPSGVGPVLAGVCQDVTEERRAGAEREALLRAEQTARQEAERARDRLSAIHSVTDAALARFELDTLLEGLLGRLHDALGSDFVSVLLLDPESRQLVLRSSSGPGAGAADEQRIPVGAGVVGRVAAQGRARIESDLGPDDVAEPWRGGRVRSVIGAPLLVEGRVVGVVAAGSARRRGFTGDHLELLQLVADRVAPAIESQRLLEELRASQRQLHATTRKLMQVEESERARLARELHDQVGQLLTSLLLTIDRLAEDPSPSNRREALGAVEGLISQVRDLSAGLHPPVLEDLGLEAALRAHFGRFAAQTGVTVDFECAGLEWRLAPEQELCVFRIVQESLTNVARHAGPCRASVAVRVAGDWLEARVEDAGPGFDVEAVVASGSSGIAGMRERARLLGGALDLGSSAAGTRVGLRLPLERTAAEAAG